MGRYGLVAVVLLVACRGRADGAPLATDATETDSPRGAAGAEPTQAVETAPDGRDTRNAETGGATAEGAESAPTTAGGGASTLAEGCGAEPVTLDEIHSGRVHGGVAVSVGKLVASSQKFLVSEAKSGSCLWGAFAATPTHVGIGSGLFLVSFGAPHAEGAVCAPGSDGLPDDLTPGDSLDVEGTLDEYAPAACDGIAPAQQLRIDVACPARRGSAGAEPEAAVIDRALADRLAAGKDSQLLRDWGGALVRLDNASALQDADDADAVFPFGVVRLEQTALEVHSRLYYFDLSEGGPRASAKAPHYRYPTTFRSITGVVFLDYCSWVLAPRDRCADLSPASEGCTAQARRP